MSLAEINKALDALDPNRLDEKGVEDWALTKLAQASKVAPAHRCAFLAHTRKQVGDAQVAFAKGDTAFTVTEFTTDATVGTMSAGSKLAKALADLDAASKTEADAGTDDDGEGEDEVESSADADELADARETTKQKKPARKAAPDGVGVEKGFHTVESDNDVWGDSLSASMTKVKIGTDGQLYVRD